MIKQIKRSEIEQELCKVSQEFIKKSYGIDLIIPIKVNKRLSTVLGRFRHYRSESKKRPLDIELSGRLLEYGSTEQIISTLKHECIHYALYMLGRPYKDGHPVFESELKKHNSYSTRTQRISTKRYIYSCGCQKFESLTNRYAKNYRCRSCGNDITLSYVDEPQPLRKIV